ncbi:aspartyl-phosphate phosphatase Spo0E family protein [Paenibacillus albidus]|uniref:aspartyl-phosphate phosphatase Spo0E family protein n=1 Tax=Paenibacillus albidus TaxID=2041023 RepID=UPI001E44A66E|nr:aspartyl-phosphate phosphatase Spo0E family protein [Paenibacillus albidus]
MERPCKGEIFEYESYLEDEIRILRSRMEQLFDQENSFTSENVIAISGLLDLKINEYMKWRKRKN